MITIKAHFTKGRFHNAKKDKRFKPKFIIEGNVKENLLILAPILTLMSKYNITLGEISCNRNNSHEKCTRLHLIFGTYVDSFKSLR